MREEARAEVNKRNVQAFYDLMFNRCRPREAIERYAGDEYRLGVVETTGTGHDEPGVHQ